MKAHGTWCKEPYKGDCVLFSTDGTRLGADIAHQFGTMDEEEIKATNRIGTLEDNTDKLTGMTAEQREWEGIDDAAEDADDSEEDF